jgi:hypothetical protein
MLRVLPVVLTMFEIGLAESFGKQELDGLTQKFILAVAKKFLSLRIDVHDTAGLVGKHDAPGNRVQQGLEEIVTPLKVLVSWFRQQIKGHGQDEPHPEQSSYCESRKGQTGGGRTIAG